MESLITQYEVTGMMKRVPLWEALISTDLLEMDEEESNYSANKTLINEISDGLNIAAAVSYEISE